MPKFYSSNEVEAKSDTVWQEISNLAFQVFQWLSKSIFLSFVTNGNFPAMEMKQNQTFFLGHFQIWNHVYFYQKILKHFKNKSFLWLKWTQTMQMKQNQTFCHRKFLNLTIVIRNSFLWLWSDIISHWSQNNKMLQWLLWLTSFNFIAKVSTNK